MCAGKKDSATSQVKNVGWFVKGLIFLGVGWISEAMIFVYPDNPGWMGDMFPKMTSSNFRLLKVDFTSFCHQEVGVRAFKKRHFSKNNLNSGWWNERCFTSPCPILWMHVGMLCLRGMAALGWVLASRAGGDRVPPCFCWATETPYSWYLSLLYQGLSDISTNSSCWLLQ